jgi:hypothetical protein
MKNLYLLATLVAYMVTVGCAPIPPIPNGPWAGQTTENRKNISIMNAETVANGMDAVRGGNRYDCRPVTAEVRGHTRATVDTDPRSGMDRNWRNQRWNRWDRWNQNDRTLVDFESDHESNVIMICN